MRFRAVLYSATVISNWWTGFGEEVDAELNARRERALAAVQAFMRGDQAAGQQARVDLEAVLAARPHDAIVRASYGSTLIRQAWSVPVNEAKSVALRGCAEMDAAVEDAPENPAVRLIRARTDALAPLALGRQRSAGQDFAWLVRGAGRATSDWPPPFRREVLFHAAAFALRQRRAADAVELLELAAKIEAATPSDEDINYLLAVARRDLGPLSGHAESPHQSQVPAATP